MLISDHYGKEKQRFLQHCVQCGLCAEVCPILPHTGMGNYSPQSIQGGVFRFMEVGAANLYAYTKAFSCMECFKCTANICPEDLNPMVVNELIKGEYIARGLAEKAHEDQQKPDSVHRVLASIQVSGADYRKITVPSPKKRARYVFFPGCNVYFQPEKILNALDIFEAIGDDFAFLPGLDYCCGDSCLFTGEIDKGERLAASLATAIAEFQPEAVVLWCPTCHCRFEKSIAPALNIPFHIFSFPQYLAANMSKLSLSDASAGGVTLHEPCKTAFTNLDSDGPREVLRQLPGVTLTEMKHHGPKTSCCGSGADCWFKESSSRVRDSRLKEAEQTGAGRLVTVCHYCGQTFGKEEERFSFTVTNYVHLVAEAMGIRRDDTFKRYALWRDLERILDDAKEHIQQSPFETEHIIKVLRAVFLRESTD